MNASGSQGGTYPVWPKIGFQDFLNQSEAEWHRCPECETPMRQDSGERLPCAICAQTTCEDPKCAAPLTPDLQCSKCGVSHTHPGCPECGRHGHHKEGCKLIGEYVG